MATEDSTENVAVALETQLTISSDETNDAPTTLSSSSSLPIPASTLQNEDHHVDQVIDVEVEFPHLKKINDDLEPSQALPAPDSDIFAVAAANVESILPTLSYAHDDFLAEFGLSEMFFIDGDSLVSYALANKTLDWSHGGQFLQFVFLAEKLLANIKDRGARFRVFFFTQHEQLWSGPSLLARQLFIYHLLKNTSIPVDIVPHHFGSQEWKNHLEFFQPAYIVSKFQWEEQEGVDHKSLNILYKAFTLSCHKVLLYTVTLEDIEFKGAKVISFLLAPVSHVQLREIYTKVLNYIVKHFVHPLDSSKAPPAGDDAISYLGKAIEGGFDGRTSISLYALHSLLVSKQATKDDITTAKLYCIYLSLVQYLPLSSRSHPLPANLPNTPFVNSVVPFLVKLASFMHPAFTQLNATGHIQERPTDKLSSNFCDAIDSHTFFTFLFAYQNGTTGNSAVDSQAAVIWAHLAASVPSLANEKFSFPEQSAKDAEAHKTALESVRDLARRASTTETALAPVESDFVSAVIPDILKEMKPFETPEVPIAPAKSLDWHTGPDFVGADHLQYKDEAPQKMKAIQRGEATKKKFIDSFLVDSPVKRKLIADLETPMAKEDRIKRAKKALQPVKAESASTSTAGPSSAKAPKKGAKEKEKKDSAIKKGSAKDKGGSKKEQIIEKAAKKRATDDSEKGKEQLANINATVAKLIKTGTSVTDAVELLDKFIKGRPTDELSLEAQIKILTYLHDEFEFAKIERKVEMVPILFVSVQTILRKYANKDYFVGSGPKKLVKFAYHFGFPDLAKAITAIIDSKPTTEKKKEKDAKASPLVDIKQSAIMYQLQQLGAHLARPQGKVVDERVSFLPDDWQETLLNVVDAQESALILAPTSSGKTFISFYCMESILRADNDGVVIYLSPTKALVNQVEAEVLARFEKKYQPGKVLTGVFTRDFRKHEKDCQILVTVPECLELLLMSIDDPAWQKRIKYVIFDEIQSLGSEGGEIWEHLLLLIDAPLLALSATVNNGEQFYDWLSDVERSRNRKMHYIKYDQRYNDLRPYVYDIANPELTSLHPFYALNLKTIEQNEGNLPVDLKLLPEHCVTLYYALDKHLSPLGIDVTDLHPDKFFKNVEGSEWNLSMSDVVRYEQTLKQKFLSIIPIKSSPAQAILDDLSGTVPEIFAKQTKIYDTANPLTILENHLYDALNLMKAKDMLPAIVFHFDRINCVHFARILSDRLANEEIAEREKDGTQDKIRALEAQLEVEKKWYEKHARDAESKIETRNLPEGVASRVERYYDLLNHYHFISRVDPRFSYLGREGAVTYEELGPLLRMRESEIKKNPLYEALRRGIAAHHAGLDKRYRQAVEKLFRMKKVRVVIATSTLAVGINMPCKSVVFAGDSPYLNTMNYRQMSGRAGRRGFDLVGHVAFFGIPEGKIKRLVTARLADMQGNLPLTVALALRMLCRYDYWNPDTKDISRDQNKQTVLNAAKRLLEKPFISLNNPTVSLVVRHQFLYSVNYLIREGYLGFDAQPRDLCGLVNTLYFLEPANYVFGSLLKGGMFDEFCQAFKKDKDHSVQLLIVLANLFGQVKLYPAHRRTVKGSPSVVILPELPKSFVAGINEHNARALQTAATYMHAFARAYSAKLGNDNSLPLSNIAFTPKATQAAGASSGKKGKKDEGKKEDVKSSDDDILGVFKSSAVEYYARSAFSAMSGKGDKFDSPTDLSDSLRKGVFLDKQLICTLDVASQGLNAYIYDFYTHKSTKSLIKYNHMKRGSLYDSLKDFMLVARSLSNSLLARVPSSPVSHELRQVADDFTSTFEEFGHLH